MAAWRPELLSPATSLLWFVIHFLPLPSFSFSVQIWAPQGLHTPLLRREAAAAWWQWGLEPADGTAFVWALAGTSSTWAGIVTPVLLRGLLSATQQFTLPTATSRQRNLPS